MKELLPALILSISPVLMVGPGMNADRPQPPMVPNSTNQFRITGMHWRGAERREPRAVSKALPSTLPMDPPFSFAFAKSRNERSWSSTFTKRKNSLAWAK